MLGECVEGKGRFIDEILNGDAAAGVAYRFEVFPLVVGSLDPG